MAGSEMLEFAYWTKFSRLNVAGPSLISTIVLFHIMGPVQSQINFNAAASDFANIVEKVGGLYNAVKGCEYTCPEGYQRVKKPGHVSSQNGCGSYGVQISLDEFPSITECCNNHDACYDTCGTDKVLCDEKLNRCVKRICDSVTANSLEQTCRSLSKVIYGSTAVLGCPAFLDAQKKACLCQPKKQTSKKYQEL